MQSAQTQIFRGNISDDVADTVRNMIVDGRLPAGERIDEVHLSQQLGVTRTPLREALARLAHEGGRSFQYDLIPKYILPAVREEGRR